MMDKWDERFCRLARHVSLWSKDPSTRVGAVVVGVDRWRIALGYNGLPRGIADDAVRLVDREVRLRLTQHAERNVLDNAAFDARGGTLYVTMFPCSECCKSIVQRGVTRVVCPPSVEKEPWASDSVWSRMILEEAGVRLDDSEGLWSSMSSSGCPGCRAVV